MPRTEEANKRLREAQQNKILDAARKVFARKGLTATMDDVAIEASVSHGLAYRYFANKEAIIYALIEQALLAPSAGLQRFLEMPGTPTERLYRLVSQLIDGRRQPELFQLLDQVLASEEVSNVFRELIYERGQELQATLRQLIVEGQDVGEVVGDDPDQLVRAVLAVADGLIGWAVHHPDHYKEHFPDAHIFLRMLRA